MSSMSSTAHQETAGELGNALSELASGARGITEVIVVSADGFPLAASAGHQAEGVEQLAAIISGLTSLTRGAADLYRFDEVRQVIVEMAGGFLFIMSIGGGSALAAIAEADCDLGTVGYEMTLLVDRIGGLLTPDVIDVLKNPLSPSAVDRP